MAWPRPANGLGGGLGDACRVAGDSDSLLAWVKWPVLRTTYINFDATCVENVLVCTGWANDVDINKKAVRISNGFFVLRAENETWTRDPNLGKVALSSPQNATRLGVTNWSISFYDDFLECVLPCFSHWLNGWLNICVCLLVCKWLLIKELFNGLNKFCNTFFLVIHWHSEFIVFK